MSCGGCSLLHEGCNGNCILRPSHEWIHTLEAQANATCFLTKFYGRTDLLNRLNACPDHLHPVILKSLLYEACGRIINPTLGVIGLLSSNGWCHLEAAVNSILDGFPFVKVPDDIDALNSVVPLQHYEICLSRKSDGLPRAPLTRTVSNQSCVNETILTESDFEILPSEISYNNYQGGPILDRVPHHSLSNEIVETLASSGCVNSKNAIASKEIDLELTLGWDLGLRGGQPQPGFGEKA